MKAFFRNLLQKPAGHATPEAEHGSGRTKGKIIGAAAILREPEVAEEPFPSARSQGKNGAEPIRLALALGDFIKRIPPHLLRPGELDLDRSLLFDMGEVADRIARGISTIRLAELIEKIPEIFVDDALNEQTLEIRFPWQRVLRLIEDSDGEKDDNAGESVGQRLRRSRKTAKRAAPLPDNDAKNETNLPLPHEQDCVGARKIPPFSGSRRFSARDTDATTRTGAGTTAGVKTIPSAAPGRTASYRSLTKLTERPEIVDPRLARDVFAMLVIFAIVATAFVSWHDQLSLRDATLAAEFQRLDRQWTTASSDLDAARSVQFRFEAFLNAIKRVAEERNGVQWTPSLRSVAVAVGPDIELRVIHVLRKADGSNGRFLRIEGIATGRGPRLIADRFRRQLQDELERHFQVGDKCRLDRVGDEEIPPLAEPGEERVSFMITAPIGAGRASGATGSSKN